MNLVEVKGISRKEGDSYVVRDIHFSQRVQEKIAIAGATGSGKSSVLKMIAGLVTPTEGLVLFNNEIVPGPEERLIPGHPKIAYLSQYFELRNHYRVKDFLSMAAKVPDEEAARIYKVCHIDHLLERWTHQLSGGEKQRIALARLLISSPKLLLLDEPYSNLDPFHKSTLKAVIASISNELEITCMLVSHDPLDTLSWADKILVLKNGTLIQTGSPQHIYYQPADDYTAALFGKYNKLSPGLFKALLASSDSAAQPVNLYTRPEAIKKVAAGHGIKGIVQRASFMGSYYELEATVMNENVIVCSHENMAKGEAIYLTL